MPPCCTGQTDQRQVDSASIKKARENKVNATEYQQQLKRIAEENRQRQRSGN